MAAVALHVGSTGEYSGPSPHAHRKGQPILSLHGAVSCEVEGALRLVPPRHAASQLSRNAECAHLLSFY